MDTTTVVRKIDSKTWEYKVTSVERLGAEDLGGRGHDVVAEDGDTQDHHGVPFDAYRRYFFVRRP